jgi:hypothetical protein
MAATLLRLRARRQPSAPPAGLSAHGSSPRSKASAGRPLEGRRLWLRQTQNPPWKSKAARSLLVLELKRRGRDQRRRKAHLLLEQDEPHFPEQGILWRGWSDETLSLIAGRKYCGKERHFMSNQEAIAKLKAELNELDRELEEHIQDVFRRNKVPLAAGDVGSTTIYYAAHGTFPKNARMKELQERLQVLQHKSLPQG